MALVARYLLNEGSGVSLADSSGNGYTGTLNSDTGWTNDGDRGWVYNFNGVTSRWATLPSLFTNPVSEMSFKFFAKINSIAAADSPLGPILEANGLKAANNSGRPIYVRYYESAAWNITGSPWGSALSTGAWNEYEVRFKAGDAVSFWKDNVQLATEDMSAVGALEATGGTNWLGKRTDPNNKYALNQLSDVRIYDTQEPTPDAADGSIVRAWSSAGVKSPIIDRMDARVTGLTASDFTIVAKKDDVVESVTVTVTEIGNGEYDVSFTPEKDGHWIIYLTRTATGEKFVMDVNELPEANQIYSPSITQTNGYQIDTKRRVPSYVVEVEANEITKARVYMTGNIDYTVVPTAISDRARVNVKDGVGYFDVYADRACIIKCTVFDLGIVNRMSSDPRNLAGDPALQAVTTGVQPGENVIENRPDEPAKPLVFAEANRSK